MAETFEELLAMVKKAKTGKEWGDIIKTELPLAPSPAKSDNGPHTRCSIPADSGED